MPSPRLPDSARTALRLRFDAHPIFASLSAAHRDRCWSLGQLRSFAPGEHLSRDGEPAKFYWLLLDGAVRVYYTSPQGSEVTVKIFAAPAAWAEMQILTHHSHTEDCCCIERAWCWCLPAADFVRLLDDHPLFMKQVLIDTSARFLIAAQHERALAFLDVAERLAHLLLSYVRIYGVKTDHGIRIDTRLSHEQLAADLGIVKKSVTRTLSQWTAEGVVVKSGNSYVIPNMALLVDRSPKGLIGVDWSTGGSVQARQLDDNDTDVKSTRKR
jgi:CRP-like cAMP-binding protein